MNTKTKLKPAARIRRWTWVEAGAYLEAHCGRLNVSQIRTRWPDGRITEMVWQYSADSTCVSAAKTALEAIQIHMVSGKSTEKRRKADGYLRSGRGKPPTLEKLLNDKLRHDGEKL